MGVYVNAVYRKSINVEIQGRIEPVYFFAFLYKPRLGLSEAKSANERDGRRADRLEDSWKNERPRFVVDIGTLEAKPQTGSPVYARYKDAPITLADSGDRQLQQGGREIGKLSKSSRKWILLPELNIEEILAETASTTLGEKIAFVNRAFDRLLKSI